MLAHGEFSIDLDAEITNHRTQLDDVGTYGDTFVANCQHHNLGVEPNHRISVLPVFSRNRLDAHHSPMSMMQSPSVTEIWLMQSALLSMRLCILSAYLGWLRDLRPRSGPKRFLAQDGIL
jgi:hypothetical protein